MVPGALFADRFEIERSAATGGMGAVYRAKDRHDGGSVALKLLRQGVREDVRFEREARILSQLDHAGIVRLVEHGRTAEGIAWIAMEWLDGEDLAVRLARGRLSTDETIALGLAVADALAAAHALGVVHRDVKPSNLFLPGGVVERVKVIDFGIARGDADLRATASGTTVGTPAYMAPEQAQGTHGVDLRADVFSLGSVLFECLAGRPPFEGQHAMAVLAKLLFEQPPFLADLVPGVPRALAALITRMLAKRPEHRPAGALEVARALVGLSSAEGPEPAPALTADEQGLVSVIVAGSRPEEEEETRKVSIPMGETREDPVGQVLGTLRVVIAPFGGRIERLADGSLVAVIEGSGGATDRAARAARCALSLRAVIDDGPLALATGRGLLGAGLPIGEAIDRAVGLLRTAQRGEEGRRARVIVDPVTAGLLDARWMVEERGGLVELAGERDAHPGEARTLLGKPTPCVGRDREIAAIEAVFEGCADDGAARAVVVTGPAGIGKSRVAGEVRRRVEARPDTATVWIAQGDSMGAGSSGGLLVRLLARAAGIAPGEDPAAARDKLRAHVASRIEGEAGAQAAEFLGELVGVPFPDTESVKLRAARQDARLLWDQIRRALTDLLSAECARGPVLVVLEDLQWADAPSVAFIDEALRRLVERPLLVLGLARPDVHDRFPALWAERGAQEIRLRELPKRAAERLAREALGEGASGAVIARVVEQAAGHPFYLEELLRAAAEGDAGAPPPTVLAMVQARLESLSPGARRTLRAGSIFGEAFWSGSVRALLGDASATDGEAALAELMDREIVERRESRFPGEEERAFRHALVREAAYAMLTDADLATGHRLAGAWLVSAGERDAMRLAEHFERGADGPRAAVWYRHGAEQALAANDLPAAIFRARRAVDLGAEGEDLAAVLVTLGEAHLWRGESSLARPALEEAMRLLPQGTPPWFRAAMRLGWALENEGDRVALPALARVVGHMLGPSPPGPALVAAARIACQLLVAGFPAEAEPFVARLAPVLADPSCDPGAAAHVHELAAFCALRDGDIGTASVHMSASAQAFDAVGDARQTARAANNAANALSYLGQYEEAEAEARAAMLAADRLGLQNISSNARGTLGAVLFQRGAREEARAFVVEALAVTQADPRSESYVRCYLSAILLDTGDPAGAEAEATRAVSLSTGAPPARCLALAHLARARIARSLPEGALHDASLAMETLDQLGGIEEGDALVRLVFAEALDACGRPGPASSAIAAAAAHLVTRASRIADPDRRKSFLTRVPENARTLELAGEWATLPGIME